MNRRRIKRAPNISIETDRALSSSEGTTSLPHRLGRPGRYGASIDKLVVESYLRLGSSLKVADELGVGASYVRSVCSAAGVLKPVGVRRSDFDIRRAHKRYLDGEKMSDLAKELGFGTANGLRQAFRRQGLEPRPVDQTRRSNG